MRYNVKWRVQGRGPLELELLSSAEEAKERARDLLREHGNTIAIEIWNEDELGKS